MAKKKKSKKDLSNAYPYFLINSAGKITYVDEKGKLADGGYLPAKNNKLALGGNPNPKTTEDIYLDQRNPQTNLGDPNWLANMGKSNFKSEEFTTLNTPNVAESKDSINEKNGTGLAGIIGTLGSIGGSLIDDGTNIAEDRSMNKNKAIGSGVLKGVGTGAQLGATVGGGPGALIGAAVGGIAGGFSGADRKNKEISDYKKYMAEKNSMLEIPTTQYLAAYGGDLNLLGPGDPPKKDKDGNIIKSTGEGKAQADIPKQSKGDMFFGDVSTAQYKQWQERNRPYFETLFSEDNPNPEETFDPSDSTQVRNFQEWYNKNKTQGEDVLVDEKFGDQTVSAWIPQKMSLNPLPPASTDTGLINTDLAPGPEQHGYRTEKTTDPITGEFRSINPVEANKKESIKSRIAAYKARGLTEEDTEIASLLEEYNAPYVMPKRDAASAARTTTIEDLPANIQALPGRVMVPYGKGESFADGGNLSQDTSLTGKPTEYNGNTHEEGGIDLGAAEVEDGEIRVGDYVFSDRLTTTKGKTFADEAKKITDQFEEYENDSAAKRTQNKQLEELKFQNDQAKLLKEKEEAEFEMSMQQDVMAYGGMIKKDARGKYQVDRSNRKALMGAAKERKMSYNKYVDTIYKYGGDLKSGKKQYANGGGLTGEGINPEISTDEPMAFVPRQGAESMFSLPELELMQQVQDRGMGVNSLPIREASEVTRKAPTAVQGNNPYQVDNILPLFEGEPAPSSEENSKFGREEQALLSSQIPAAANTFSSLIGQSSTNFDRLSLDPISMEQERNNIRNAMARAKQTHRQNVRGTATSAGDALAALSAGTAGLAGQEAKALASIDERERNINTQLSNQEAMTNLNISNQEMVARQQDQAKRASVRNAALANMSDNVQGYLKDKTLGEENDSYNKKLMSLLETGEYKMIPDGDGGYMIQYKNPNKKDDTTVTETIKSEE